MMRVLVTCGATWTPIDDVRVISNTSSGEMGHLIARAFLARKAKVTVIEGPVTDRPLEKGVHLIKYRFFDQLAALFRKELARKYDIIVHAAAVSDFKVKKAVGGKLSSGKPMTLKLIPTPKLIDEVKKISPQTFLVGFKLEPHINQKRVFTTVRPLVTQSGCDLVVANSTKGGYAGFIVNADGEILAKAKSKHKLAEQLAGLLV